MVKASHFVCQQCGVSTPKWSGQCPNCSEWNSLVETVVSPRVSRRGRKSSTSRGAAKPVNLSEVEGIAEKRISTGIGEFDRVLGGGIVPGSVVLVAGEPGIGKSTLLTQLALRVANGKKPSAVLYVCGEESPGQIKMRVERLNSRFGGDPTNSAGRHSATSEVKNIMFLPEVDVDIVTSTLESLDKAQDKKEKPGLVIIDSIQTMLTSDLTSSAGRVSQVSESASRLSDVAKRLHLPMFLVGHVTKEGTIAGPKVLEHMVDTVLELTGDRLHEFRILRASKNRFGATDEVGIFTMEDRGMQEVTNPSDRFLAERQAKVPGSSIVCVFEGTRPMLVEVQALVVPSSMAVPRRVASGVDARRVQLLTAVLIKRCGLRLGNMDVYVNVAGGLTIREPASDFGIAMAIASSIKNRALPKDSVVIGEIGLLGEVRKVGRLKQRLSEAKAQGFKRIITAQEYSSLRDAIRTILRLR